MYIHIYSRDQVLHQPTPPMKVGPIDILIRISIVRVLIPANWPWMSARSTSSAGAAAESASRVSITHYNCSNPPRHEITPPLLDCLHHRPAQQPTSSRFDGTRRRWRRRIFDGVKIPSVGAATMQTCAIGLCPTSRKDACDEDGVLAEECSPWRFIFITPRVQSCCD